MTKLTREQVKELILKTQGRYEAIQHEQWNEKHDRYGMTDSAMWRQAAQETAPAEWAGIIRVLAQGESYYDGNY